MGLNNNNPNSGGGGGSVAWGGVTGDITNQTDLQSELNTKVTIGGDTKGSKVTVGTNDAQPFAIETNNVERISVTDAGAILIGADANTTDYPNANVIIADGNTGHTFSGKIGITAEVLSNGVDPCTGVGGNAATNGGSVAARGVTGVAIASNPTDAGNAIGVYAYSNSVHTAGNNFGVNAKASNANSNFGVYSEASGGTNNWSFYGQAGNLYNDGSIAIKNTNPTKDLSFDGTANRTAGVERNTTANTAGNNLTINAGSATTGATDKAGGNLILSSGDGTGNQSSKVSILTSSAGTSGATGNAATEKLTILGNGNIGINNNTPEVSLDISPSGSTGISILRMRCDTTAFDVMQFFQSSTIKGAIGYYGNTNPVFPQYAGAMLSLMVEPTIGRFIWATNSGSGMSIKMTLDNNGALGVGTTTPSAKLDVAGGIKIADDTDAAAVTKVGTIRYRTSGNNSYMDMCMQTGASTYEWVNIKTNSW